MYAASVAVIGGGEWGLALAAAAARTGTNTSIYSRRSLDGRLPKDVRGLKDLAAVASARLIVLATPSGVTRDVARRLGDVVDGRHLLVHGTRGLAGDAMDRISEVLRQ